MISMRQLQMMHIIFIGTEWMFLNLKIEWVEFCNLSRAPEEIPHQKLKVTPACAPEVGSQIRLRLVCVGTKGDWVYLRKVAWLIFIYFFFNQPT